MAVDILGYKELLKVLVEYQITLINRLKNEGYDQSFSILLIPLPNWNEQKLRDTILPLLRNSDRLFYIEENLIALLPNTDWNGAQKVHDTIATALNLKDIEDRVVEYPTDGENAFTLISNLYAKLDS